MLVNFLIFRAPNDCFQYLTGVSGSISSLNYPTTMLTDILYTICVRQEDGYCGIEWKQADTTTDSFELDDATTQNALVGGANASAGDAYISIPGAMHDLYSGNSLADEIPVAEDTSTNPDTPATQETTGGTIQAWGMPFTLSVNTYNVDDDDVPGFNLVYNQLPCGNHRSTTTS